MATETAQAPRCRTRGTFARLPPEWDTGGAVMLLTDVTFWTCDHCGEKRRVVRLQAASEDDGAPLPFLSLWICAECLRRLAEFTDRSPAG